MLTVVTPPRGCVSALHAPRDTRRGVASAWGAAGRKFFFGRNFQLRPKCLAVLARRSRLGGSRGVPVLVPVRASPAPSVDFSL